MSDTMSPDDGLVLVIEDDESLRHVLSSLFRSVGLQVRLFASPTEFLKETVSEQIPCCLVLDIRLPGVSGLDFQDQLRSKNSLIPIVFMTGHGDIPMSVRAMKGGAVEFLTKPFRDQDMLDAVQLALQQDRQRLGTESSTTDLRAAYETLSAREREIMKLIMEGLANKQIAGKIGLSEVTVKVHRGSLMRKMGAKSLIELVGMADVLGVR